MEFEKAVAVFKAVAVTWISTLAFAFVLVLAVLHVSLVVWLALALVVTLAMLAMFSNTGLSSSGMQWFVGIIAGCLLVYTFFAGTAATTLSLDGSLFIYIACMVLILMQQVQAVSNAAGAVKIQASNEAKARA